MMGFLIEQDVPRSQSRPRPHGTTGLISRFRRKKARFEAWFSAEDAAVILGCTRVQAHSAISYLKRHGEIQRDPTTPHRKSQPSRYRWTR